MTSLFCKLFLAIAKNNRFDHPSTSFPEVLFLCVFGAAHDGASLMSPKFLVGCILWSMEFRMPRKSCTFAPKLED